MPYYTYSQNNSGGVFTEPAQYVIIEADSADEADTIATYNGLYFNGVDDGVDCPCCGDRWHTAIESYRTNSPEIYGKSVEDSFREEISWMKSLREDIPYYVIINK